MQHYVPPKSLGFICTAMSSHKCHYHFNLLNKAILHVTFYLYFTLISAYAAYRMLHIVPVAWIICNYQHAADKRA